MIKGCVIDLVVITKMKVKRKKTYQGKHIFYLEVNREMGSSTSILTLG